MNIKTDKTPEDFQHMEQMELEYYSEKFITPWKEAYLWNLSNPKTGYVLEDCGRIVAFTDILPVRQEVFDGIVNGSFDDKYLTENDLVKIEELKAGDCVNLLLACILVDEDYRETDALKTLLNAHMDYYRSFAGLGIQIETVVTSNVTRAGERFSERMGFDRIGRSGHDTTLFRTSFRQFDERIRAMKPRLEGKLLQYEKNLLDPIFCSGAGNLEGCIAKEFMEYGQSGTVYGRDAVIRYLSAAKWRNIEIQDFSLCCLNRDAAEVHYIAFEKGETIRESLRTSIWIREDGLWKLRFHQGTEVPNV
jgi:hypothetical protein